MTAGKPECDAAELRLELEEAQRQRQAAFRTIEQLQDQLASERQRIKDGLMALAMTSGELGESDQAIKAFAFRVNLMIDGHADLVMTDAAKSLYDSLQETRPYRDCKQDELEAMERHIELITRDKSSARKFLVGAEIIDANGELAKHYRTDEIK